MKKIYIVFIIGFCLFFQHACSLIVGSKPQPLDASDEDISDWDASVEDVAVEDALEQDEPIEDNIPDDVPVEPDAPDEPELPPGLVWVSIPAGSFEMGCSAGDTECDASEEPRHTVNVSAFQITQTEITQAQYEWGVMHYGLSGSATPSYFTGCGASCPVEQVNWYEAKAFCEAIGARLPSEAEWEYAARAGTTTIYICGNDPSCLDGVAWYVDNSGSTTHPVGEKTANAFGLYDMLGNVYECVEDCWHEDYTGAPSTGEVWSGGDCGYHVLRGGSWLAIRSNMRVSPRYRNYPDLWYWYHGFRCAQ